MSDEDNQENKPEKPNIESLDLQSVRQYVEMVNTQHDKDMTAINGRIEDVNATIKQMHEDLKNHINSIDKKTNSKFETIDQALRGNGRIGVFEQIRGIKVKQRFIIIFVLLLFGAKLWGMTFDDWFKDTFLPANDNPAEVIYEPSEILDSQLVIKED